MLTTAIRADLSVEAARVAEHVERHGDGVRDIRDVVDDARDAFA